MGCQGLLVVEGAAVATRSLEEVDVSRLVPWYGYEVLVFLKKICGHP